jgi:hypothetical protein
VTDPPPAPSVPLVMDDWDAVWAERVAPTDAEIDRRHKVRWGASLGAVPQVVMLILCVLLWAAGAGPYAWMVMVLDVYVVPLAVVVGVTCLLWRAARPFGAALLAGTLLSATVFVVVLVAIGG